jgi:hypothetical protein
VKAVRVAAEKPAKESGTGKSVRPSSAEVAEELGR